jgi:hypothetical protein
MFWNRPQRGNGGPRYGSVPIYPDTPYSSIYVGLEADNEQALYDVIAKYGETNGIQRCKSYVAYSGPPLATYTSLSTSVIWFSDRNENTRNAGKHWLKWVC